MESHGEQLISPVLLAEIEALAAIERRPAHEMVHEAVETYLRERQASAIRAAESPAGAQLTPREAAARLLELRKFNVLPQGMTIRDMQTHGRA